MGKKLPEMLYRWNAFERIAGDILREAKDNPDSSIPGAPCWEEAVRKLDQAIAAATLRGDHLVDTSDEIMDTVWNRFDTYLAKVMNERTS
jgi:hypothetical protein